MRATQLSLVFFAAALLLALAEFEPSAKNWLLEYHPGADWRGPATVAWVRSSDFDVPRDALIRGLPDREDFSVRLRSCFMVPEDQSVAFRVEADDRAILYLDGKQIADSSTSSHEREHRGKGRGKRGRNLLPVERVNLSRGNHAIAIEYVNATGPAKLTLKIAQTGVHDFRSPHDRLRRPHLDGTCDPL